MSNTIKISQSKSLLETEKVGEELGRALVPGAVVLLIGELGSGKTTMIKGLARGLGIKELVTSPTFKLIGEYQGRLPLYHFDLYRLKGIKEVEELGFEEYIYGTGVTVIEWAEKIRPLWPANRIEVHLKIVSEKEREISIEDFSKKTDKRGGKSS